jgi:hypothetical protein
MGNNEIGNKFISKTQKHVTECAKKNKIRKTQSSSSSLFSMLALLLHSHYNLLRRIENSISLSPTGIAPLTLLVVLQCTLLAEVMLALCHYWVDE